MNPMVTIAPALLEEWMREYYFKTEFDIGSSGVESTECRDVGTLRTELVVEQMESHPVDSFADGDRE